jgi:hypothetical protein
MVHLNFSKEGGQMKKLSAIAIPLALFLMSSPAAYPQAEQTTKRPPPVAPTLVREGEFATSLASGLEMGTAVNETEAEALLASAGIAPKNGWISDYPVTPDILGELQDAVSATADSNRLPMGKDEALEVLESVSADLGLYILADNSGDYAETPPPATPQYTEPTVINNYYYREGPPVITYYPPPPDYLYLYAWVPYPFWYSRFFFSGFFILHDFHKVSIIHHRVVVVTNQVFHRHRRRFFKVDPVKRRWGRSVRGVAKSSHRRKLTKAETHRGARSILQRSHDRIPSQKRISPQQNFQRALRGSARSFTAFGINAGRPFDHPTARGRDFSETARKIRTFNGHAGEKTKTSPRQHFQKAHRDAAKFFKAPGGSEGRSSGLPSMGERGFAGRLGKGSKNFSEKVFKKLPGGSALKGAVKLPF